MEEENKVAPEVVETPAPEVVAEPVTEAPVAAPEETVA
jgi:hypothetical protein